MWHIANTNRSSDKRTIVEVLDISQNPPLYLDFTTDPLTWVTEKTPGCRVELDIQEDGSATPNHTTVLTLPDGIWKVQYRDVDTDNYLGGEMTVPSPPPAVMVVPAVSGALLPIISQSVVVPVYQGTEISIPYDLKADYPGYEPFFAFKLGLASTTYVIGPRSARVISNRTGSIDLTADDLDMVAKLVGELELRLTADPTKKLKPIHFTLDVRESVIK